MSSVVTICVGIETGEGGLGLVVGAVSLPALGMRYQHEREVRIAIVSVRAPLGDLRAVAGQRPPSAR